MEEPRKKNGIASDPEPCKAHWSWHGAAQGCAGTCQGIEVYWDLVHGCGRGVALTPGHVRWLSLTHGSLGGR